jgi:hypothetical protein
MPQVGIAYSNWGVIGSGNHSSFSNARNATNGGILNKSLTPLHILVSAFAGRGGGVYNINRTFVWWDTSQYAGSITAVDFTFLAAQEQGGAYYIIQESTAFGGNGSSSLVGSDYSSLTATSYANRGPWNPGAMTPFSGNAASVSAANTGIVIIAIINWDYDYNNINPMLPTDEWAEVDANANQLELLVTYTSGYGNEVSGVTSTNIGEVEGVTTANIGEISGI